MITQELRDRVIRAYTVKEMSINIIGKFVCERKVAERILKEAGIDTKKNGMRKLNLSEGWHKTY